MIWEQTWCSLKLKYLFEGNLLKKLVRLKLYKEAHSEAALSIYGKTLTDWSLESIGKQAVEGHAFNIQRCQMQKKKHKGCRMTGEAKDSVRFTAAIIRTRLKKGKGEEGKEMFQEQVKVKKKIPSMREWKIGQVGHFMRVIEGARENQGA